MKLLFEIKKGEVFGIQLKLNIFYINNIFLFLYFIFIFLYLCKHPSNNVKLNFYWIFYLICISFIILKEMKSIFTMEFQCQI